MDLPVGSIALIIAYSVGEADLIIDVGWDESTQTSYDVTTPAEASLIPSGSFRQIVAGNLHACAIGMDYSVTCWGDNSYGQSTPPSGQFIKITAGGNATCGISTTGYPYCWGDGYSSDEWGATTYTPPLIMLLIFLYTEVLVVLLAVSKK